MNVEQADSRYPRAGKYVDGLLVRDHVPNLSSIDGEFEESETLRGVRTVPMSDFGGPRTVLYATDDFERSERLARAIDASEEINPLIVGVDDEGPFLIEGAHRFVALCYLKKREFPAIVVVEELVSRRNPTRKRSTPLFGYSSKVSVGGGQLSPWEATAAVAGVTIVLAALAYLSIKSSVAAVVPTAPVPVSPPVQPVPVPPNSPGF